jgi:MYXO-CTERM domain-containing protein
MGATSCADSVTVAVPLAQVEPFITLVFQADGRMPWRAGRAQPPSDIGGACAQDNECNSNYCAIIGSEASSEGFCSKSCTSQSDCTNGTVCTGPDWDAGTAVCLAPFGTPTARGCSVSGSGAPVSRSLFSALSGLAALALVFLRVRRRSSK